MMICKSCNVPMLRVMSFSMDKQEKFFQCPKCRSGTRRVRIKESELNFGEEIHRKGGR